MGPHFEPAFQRLAFDAADWAIRHERWDLADAIYDQQAPADGLKALDETIQALDLGDNTHWPDPLRTLHRKRQLAATPTATPTATRSRFRG